MHVYTSQECGKNSNHFYLDDFYQSYPDAGQVMIKIQNIINNIMSEQNIINNIMNECSKDIYETKLTHPNKIKISIKINPIAHVVRNARSCTRCKVSGTSVLSPHSVL